MEIKKAYKYKRTNYRLILKMAAAFALAIVLCFAVGQYYSQLKPETASLGSRMIGLMPIVIDPGHGGGDPGKVGSSLNESDINLAIAQKLERLLSLRGFYAIMTRTGKEGLVGEDGKWAKKTDMEMRKQIITSSKALAAISIHQNSHYDSRSRGAQVFYSSTLEENALLAGALQKKLSQASPYPSNREIVVNNELMVLRSNLMPSALIECGFLSNEAEEALLVSEEYQEKLACAIYEGICEFLGIAP
jgi:N-acetylmuramoyl-L-alanine amidase